VGFCVSFLLLAVFYYLIITPIGLYVRKTGRLSILLNKQDSLSFWEKKVKRSDTKYYKRI